MDSYDSETGLIFQRFSRSTRFTYLSTAQISKIQLKIVKIFAKLNIEYSIFFNIWSYLAFFDSKFGIFLSNFWWILIGISRQTSENDKICRDFAKIPRNNSENCRNCRNFRNNSICRLNNSIVSLPAVDSTALCLRRFVSPRPNSASTATSAGIFFEN